MHYRSRISSIIYYILNFLIFQQIEENTVNEDNVIEIGMSDDDQPPNTQEVLAQLQEIIVPVDETSQQKDENSSNFAFEEFPNETLTYEQTSNDKEEDTNNVEESQENLFLAEENANSFPSACDENSRTEDKTAEEMIVDSNEFELGVEVQENDAEPDSDNDKNSLVKDVPEVAEIIANADDEKPTENAESNTTGESDFAIAENLENGASENTDLDAEMVSEDELPAPNKPKVQDAEEVSDDELPGPKLAELPADTEVVSEEELPNSSKKDTSKRKLEDYDPSSPTDDTEAPEKKIKTEGEGGENVTTNVQLQIVTKTLFVEKSSEKPKPKLPELDRYWKAVNDDSADFTAWTYLLQYVDQEVKKKLFYGMTNPLLIICHITQNDIEAAREAYDAFLAHYPYCYGYWRKYADYEKRKGNKKKCEEVSKNFFRLIDIFF